MQLQPWRAARVLWIVGLTTVSLGPGLTAKPAGERIDALKAKRQATVAKRRAVESKLRAVKQRQRFALSELNQTEQAVNESERGLRLAKARLGGAESKLRQTEADLGTVNRSLETQTEALWKRLEVFYKEGSVGYVAVALGASDFEQFVDRAVLLRSLAEDDLRLKQQIQRDQQRQMALKTDREQSVRELESLRRQFADKKSRLQTEAGRKQRLLASIREDRAAQDQAYGELVETQREIERALYELQNPAAHLDPRGGNFAGGFIKPSAGGVSSGFGWRIHPILRTRRFHDGIDLNGGYGSTIRAAAAGTVVRAGGMRAYGTTVMVNHGNGYVTLYGHCSALLVSVGQRVSQGQPIARIGSTGWSTGPHLHFSVYRNGQAINPL
jgi:murein DD-endopeptidase MepM/ murein hydrolase activator NlpD